jgi:hypothetical protein
LGHKSNEKALHGAWSTIELLQGVCVVDGALAHLEVAVYGRVVAIVRQARTMNSHVEQLTIVLPSRTGAVGLVIAENDAVQRPFLQEGHVAPIVCHLRIAFITIVVFVRQKNVHVLTFGILLSPAGLL